VLIQQIIEKDIPSGIYYMAGDEPVSINQLVLLIAESQNRKALIWKIPTKIINITARLGDILHLPLNSERLKKLTESYVVSNRKI